MVKFKKKSKTKKGFEPLPTDPKAESAIVEEVPDQAVEEMENTVCNCIPIYYYFYYYCCCCC